MIAPPVMTVTGAYNKGETVLIRDDMRRVLGRYEVVATTPKEATVKRDPRNRAQRRAKGKFR